MKLALLVMLALSLTACAPTLKMEQHAGEMQINEDAFPRKVAILPFHNETDEAGIDALVRRNFANHFSSKAYLDSKLPAVDEKLILFEKSSGKTLDQATPAEISAALAADGLLYGKVTDYKRIYAGVYSQFGVEAEVWLLNAQTGKELFRFKESVRYHEGGIPTSPLAAVVTAISTAMNLRDIQKVRLINELCYKFMEQIPTPKSVSADTRPQIKEVLTNAAEGPFGPKRVIRVGLEGEPGLVASFDIGNFKKGVAMKELKPGIYTGEYAVLPGDATRDMPITVTLSRPGGYETQWVDPAGFIAIDTTPPPPAVGLRVKGYPDRIHLQWDAVRNVPDLKGYRVLRSESPLSGYKEVAAVELPSYTDLAAAAGAGYYYRIVSYDQVGNQAEASDGVRGALVAAEPQKLAGELKGDTVLDGYYLVTGSLRVPKGVSLTISGESRLLFAPKAALQVEGRLIVAGSDTPVEFFPLGEGEWEGIVLDGAHASMSRFTVRGAATGIASRESQALLEDGLVGGCRTGLAISGMLEVQVKGVTVSGNVTGLRLTGTAARVSGCNIVQNKDGVAADGFSGEIRDNNLLDNDRNIRSEKLLEVGPNWFGTIQSDALKLGNVSVGKVYDGRLPGASQVAPYVNPYALLTPEERRKKGAELAIEAGSYFRQRNYGKSSALFAENLQLAPSSETYYYLSLCHLEMKEQDKALKFLREGTGKFPQDPLLWKSLGMLFYEKGEETEARKALEEVLRLSPEDRQARFVLERLKDAGKP